MISIMLFMIKTNLLLLLMMTKKTTMMIMMMLLMLVVVSVGGAEMMRYDKKWWEMRIQSWYNKGHRDRIHSNEPGINDYDFTKWWPQMCASGMPAVSAKWLMMLGTTSWQSMVAKKCIASTKTVGAVEPWRWSSQPFSALWHMNYRELFWDCY